MRAKYYENVKEVRVRKCERLGYGDAIEQESLARSIPHKDSFHYKSEAHRKISSYAFSIEQNIAYCLV